jgi:ankyrin repeat protein
MQVAQRHNNGCFDAPFGVAFKPITAEWIAPAFTASKGSQVVANFGAPRQFKHAPPDDGYVSVHDAAKSRQSQGDNARLNQPDCVVTVLDGSHDSFRTLTIDNADGVTTDTRNAMGAALCASSKCGDLEMLRILLNAGADVNYKDTDGKTAVELETETSYRTLDTSRLLLKRGDLVRSTADPKRTGTVTGVDTHPISSRLSCPYRVQWDDSGDSWIYQYRNQIEKIMTLNKIRSSIRKTLFDAGCLPSDALNNAAAALCAASKSGDLLLVSVLFKAGTDVNYTDTDGKTQNAIALAANSDTLRIFSPLWAPTKEGKLEVKTSAGEIKELEFMWAGFGSRPSSIIDVAAVLCEPEHAELFCDPEHAEQELSSAEQLRGNVAVVKRMKKENVTVAGVEGRRANELNGHYEDTDDLYNGKPLFRKRNDPGGACEWLRNDKDNQWMFSKAADKDSTNTGCCCRSLEAGKDHPTHVNKWNIYANGANESWEVHALMKCSSSHSTTFVEMAQRAEKAGARALVVINR